ncbi:helix-turn-helix transcriptional regulator [Actinomadura sp. DC4]|nr:helix-turn-helix transcriptional regulator [Actinomadura sp. DC4]MDN3359091.1 helix-turn-helix transcriptional regulator [Actinomadura sp. DC4]
MTADESAVASPWPLTGGTTVLRIVLGSELRRLRTMRRIGCEEAAIAIDATHDKLDRIEVGQEELRRDDIADLLTLYGVIDQAERRSLLALALKANKPGWWHKRNDDLPVWFDRYTGLEGAASLISAYGEQLVPALLQTDFYARAVIMLGDPGVPADELERRVEVQTRRQALLHRDDPPHFWAVVDEMALRRPFAGRAALRAQLRHLLDLIELPHVTLQVLPFERGGHAFAAGPFNILRFPDPRLPDVVHQDQLTSALYLDRLEDIDRYSAAMARLRIDAEPADTARRVLVRVLREL